MWLDEKIYIEFSTEKRTSAANSFEKSFFKLMVNSVYGKTMENLRKIIKVRPVNNETDLIKYTSRPTHITHKIFGRNYDFIHEFKAVLTLYNGIYVGFTVLELSKWLMYDVHYSFIKKQFDAGLLFTDTDTLTYEIKSNVYEGLFKHKHLFDFSNYPNDSKLFDETYKKIIGKMKDEYQGKIIGELVGLMSKMYSMKNIDRKESITKKWVKIATECNEF